MIRLLLFFLLFSIIVNAHPGIGIVKDRQGNIYYTDLQQVWKINTNGKRSIVVNNVHTHELYIDAHDNLYGEHLWYNGEKLDTWGHYVWCLQNNGRLDTVVGPGAGFLQNYSFVRDAAGNMYWVERFVISKFKKKAKDGTISTILEGKFKDVRWLYATPKGELIFIDQYDLYKIDTTNKLKVLAKNIADNTPSFSTMKGRHSLFGIWTDVKGNIYSANYSGQVVKQITPDGEMNNFVHSANPWSPTGGVFDDEGALWLLEASLKNEVRVRKIEPSHFFEPGKTPLSFKNYILPLVLILLLPIALVILFKIRKKKSYQGL